MFDHTDKPRIFGMPPGADFGEALVSGLQNQFADLPPEAVARVQIFVNTSRMQRRLRAVFDAGPAQLLPRVRLITDLALQGGSFDLPAPASPLRRRLELTQFVSALLAQEPDLAPRAALYDLSDSLATLMDEMQGEGVSPDKLIQLDVTDQSGHWQRALKFLKIVQPFFGAAAQAPDKEARQRLIIERLVAQWAKSPPHEPIIVAGSTGSRGATALLMKAVARLPQGALVLPGFDFEMPQESWSALDASPPPEDHPQFRFHKLLQDLELKASDVKQWDSGHAPAPDRNKLVSLSLRPAPVTNAWLTEGPTLGNLETATQNMTLVETASQRIEAETIALRLRQAAQDGVAAALISPDRVLTRQVAAALDRWDIVPDDSAGMPLAQSAPGRFLRHTAQLVGSEPTTEDVIVILKHPICNTGGDDRGDHLRRTRDLELHVRKYGPPVLDDASLSEWAQRTSQNDPGRIAWAAWIIDALDRLRSVQTNALTDLLQVHLNIAKNLAQGPDGTDAGELWKEAAGREAARVCDMLCNDADAGGELSPFDYIQMFNAILANGVVRNRDAGHPNILIWGTLEARVQGADLVILGGLNDGIWPESPSPDPWLNRAMRQEVGLLLPDRRIGLSAHDYQQAVAAKEVWITRSRRSADAETVPSRWLNRLTNLLDGLPKQNGKTALERMRCDGDAWIAKAVALQTPQSKSEKATRPSPRPPIAARPKELSVTRIKTLIRDPFAIYADKILRLRPLDPLRGDASPMLRGEIFHKILERFISEHPDATDPTAMDRFLKIAQEELDRSCPWPTVRMQWMIRLERSASVFLQDESQRQSRGTLALIEATGTFDIPDPAFRIVGKADRIDRSNDGSTIIYDYKTGQVPTKTQQQLFDKQLLIEAAMAERGAFSALGKTHVSEAAFIGVNTDMKVVPAPLSDDPTDKIWADFLTLLHNWNDPNRGYTARLAHFSVTDTSPYDHLSRLGEWTMADNVTPVVLL